MQGSSESERQNDSERMKEGRCANTHPLYHIKTEYSNVYRGGIATRPEDRYRKVRILTTLHQALLRVKSFEGFLRLVLDIASKGL